MKAIRVPGGAEALPEPDAACPGGAQANVSLKPADGAIGGHAAAVQDCYRDFGAWPGASRIAAKFACRDYQEENSSKSPCRWRPSTSASAREKSIRQGHPSTLHLWWAHEEALAGIPVGRELKPVTYRRRRDRARMPPDFFRPRLRRNYVIIACCAIMTRNCIGKP